MSVFTPEQQKEIADMEARLRTSFMSGLASIQDSLDAKYSKQASAFRVWLKTKDPLWVAQRIGTTAFICGGMLVYGVLHLLGKV